MLAASLLLVAPLLATAIPTQHTHTFEGNLPKRWYHEEDHPVHSLFRRGPDDGTGYAPVGSPTWSAGFPRGSPDVNQLPQAWVDALNTAVQADKIPDVPQSTNTPQTNPTYPQGVDPNGQSVCSATYKCRNPDDIWDAPDGYFASSFDDGPLAPTDALNTFLKNHNVTTTHFMIGTNILANWNQFLHVLNDGHDIAVHTWTHPYMTTLSNLQIVAQLGWTMELIHNSTGGRVPRYWRPPYGDSDNRVRAIAKEVFGMDTVIWNQDSEDWSLSTGGTTPEKIHREMTAWLQGPKSPGLMILEHTLSDGTVNAFIDAFPMIAQGGWKFASLATLLGNGRAYQNSENLNSVVSPANILAGSEVTGENSSTPNSSTSSSPASSSSSPSRTAANAAMSSGVSPNAAVSARNPSAYLWACSTMFGASILSIVTLLL